MKNNSSVESVKSASKMKQAVIIINSQVTKSLGIQIFINMPYHNI